MTRTPDDVAALIVDRATAGLTITQAVDPLYAVDDPMEDHRARVEAAARAHLDRLPPRYRCAIMDDLDDDQAPDLLRAWLDAPAAETLLLHGTFGVGKTFAAAAVATEFATRRLRAGSFSAPVRWVTVASLLIALRPSNPDADRLWDLITTAPMLVLDDLAHVRVTEWSTEQLWLLVNARTEELGLRTVVTMNAPWKELVNCWGGGTMDRLRQQAAPVTFPGASRRALLMLDPTDPGDRA